MLMMMSPIQGAINYGREDKQIAEHLASAFGCIATNRRRSAPSRAACHDAASRATALSKLAGLAINAIVGVLGTLAPELSEEHQMHLPGH
jgi:hypothetical protein